MKRGFARVIEHEPSRAHVAKRSMKVAFPFRAIPDRELVGVDDRADHWRSADRRYVGFVLVPLGDRRRASVVDLTVGRDEAALLPKAPERRCRLAAP